MAQRVVVPGFRKIETSGGGEVTGNYNDLANKPSINNVPLVGNLRTVDLKLTDSTLTEEGIPAEAKEVGSRLEKHSTSLTALSEQLGSHTVKSDVPENAVFTDTVYDDTEIQKRISDNGYGEVAGGKNLLDYNIIASKIKNCAILYKNDTFHVTNKGSYSSFVLSVPTIVGKSYTVTIKDWSDYSYRCIISVSDLSDNTLVSMVITDATLSMTFTAVGTESLIQISPNNTPNAMSNTITFKCMLEEGSVATKYEPYFPSNKMLAEETSNNSEDVDTLKKETTVNLLNPTLETTTQNGITCTNNGDGTYTLSGTSTSQVILDIAKSIKLPKKSLLLECRGGSPDTYTYGLFVKEGDKYFEVSDRVSKLITEGTYDSAYIVVREGVTVPDNTIIKPMITTNLDATYDDFVPYTGDTGKINSDVAALLKRIEALEARTTKTDTTKVKSE